VRKTADTSETLPGRRKKRTKKPNVIETAVCRVHGGEPVDTRLLEYHHKIPLGYGGQDVPENCCWLCGTCHGSVHGLAHLIVKGQAGVAQDLAGQAFPTTPSIRGRLMELAKTAAEAQRTHQPTGNLEEEKDEVVVMQLHLPKSLHRRLKTLAANHTHQKSGRKVGLYRYCLTVLQRHCKAAETEMRAQERPEQLYRAPVQSETHATDPVLRDL
jgi:hypothetical protein